MDLELELDLDLESTILLSPIIKLAGNKFNFGCLFILLLNLNQPLSQLIDQGIRNSIHFTNIKRG
jgi:hypothetical protein